MQLTHPVKRNSFLCCIVLLCTVLCQLHAQTKNDQLTIPFGKGNSIIYALKQGTYSVVVGGKSVINSAVASCQTAERNTSNFIPYSRHTVQAISAIWGKGKRYIIERSFNGMRMQQIFDVYTGKPYFLAQVNLSGPLPASSYMSPLVALNTTLAETGQHYGLSVPFDNDMWVRYALQPLQKADYTSSEVTCLFNSKTNQGMVIGSVEHATWKTGIDVRYQHNKLALVAYGGYADSIATHDKIPHGKVVQNDSVCSSPKIMVGFFDDWRTGMEQYAQANLQAEPAVIDKWKKATPMGWNSWGALQTKLSLQNAKGVVDFLYDSCKGFRNADSTLYIDLDSYWDNMVKGGIDGDVSQLKAFVQYCKSRKFKAGIYWAPYTDWGKHDRNIEGTQYNYAAAWTKQNGKPVDLDGAYALDPTHPGTQERIVRYITRFKELGFDMIKIDFLGHAALESDRFYDPAITTGMQAYAAGMAFLARALDNKMLVYAAISPTLATGRYVHMRRIACDAFSAIDNTEYTLNSTGYGWWQSHLYQYADADHVVFKTETAGANRARLASALVTGTLITGDDFSVTGPWSETAKLLLQNKELLQVAKDGRSFQPLRAAEEKKAPQLFIKKANGVIYLAAFNYDNKLCTIDLTTAELGLTGKTSLTSTELFSHHTAPLTSIWSIQIPAADVRLYQIHTASKR